MGKAFFTIVAGIQQLVLFPSASLFIYLQVIDPHVFWSRGFQVCIVIFNSISRCLVLGVNYTPCEGCDVPSRWNENSQFLVESLIDFPLCSHQVATSTLCRVGQTRWAEPSWRKRRLIHLQTFKWITFVPCIRGQHCSSTQVWVGNRCRQHLCQMDGKSTAEHAKCNGTGIVNIEAPFMNMWSWQTQRNTFLLVDTPTFLPRTLIFVE